MPASNARLNDSGEFKGKCVLVTGGTKGAGKAIADRFLQGGETVVITARSAPADARPFHPGGCFDFRGHVEGDPRHVGPIQGRRHYCP